MWNMNDVYVATERYEDIRRTADKHNALARMEAEGQGEQQEARRKQKLWERVRKALR